MSSVEQIQLGLGEQVAFEFIERTSTLAVSRVKCRYVGSINSALCSRPVSAARDFVADGIGDAGVLSRKMHNSKDIQ